MAALPSNMLPLGTVAPDFNLYDVCLEKKVSLQDLRSVKATVIMFICNHCPYVIHIREKLIAVANTYQAQGVQFIAINSNDIDAYPADAPLHMKEAANTHHYPFPYLFDATQDVARAYQAACTPDFYIFDKNLQCVYRGRFDDATPKNDRPVTGSDLSEALDSVLAGQPVDEDQRASLGCSIKWKK